MIKVITNNLGSGDWVKIQFGNEVLFEGHRISPQDFVDIINGLGDAGRSAVAHLVEVTDEQMEEM